MKANQSLLEKIKKTYKKQIEESKQTIGQLESKIKQYKETEQNFLKEIEISKKKNYRKIKK